jgi:uncharacterized OB-fold protein
VAYTKPLPVPTPETKEYWDGAKRHELRIPYCRACSSWYWYPRPFCPRCHSWDVEWRTASGRGRLHTFGIQYRAQHPGFQEAVPYVTALVDLAEGPRLMTNLVGVEPDPAKIKVGMAVEVTFDDVTPEITLPKFRPAAG